jgi:hypothetical protein
MYVGGAMTNQSPSPLASPVSPCVSQPASPARPGTPSLVARRPRLSLATFVSLAVMAVLLLLGGPALASSYTLKTPEVTESSGEWHIKVRIDLSRPPPMMHTPMRFTFSKEAVDERAIMTKGADPVHHRVVLETSQKQIVGMDVDFADPSGKVFKSTYFEFDLARKDGYFEAGEYLMTLSGPDGDVGTAQKLMLKGDNPPIYRGAMDFSGDPKAAKKKKGPTMEAVGSGVDGGSQDTAQNDSPSAGPASTDVAASGDAPSMVPKSAFGATPEEETVKDHPSGCGCVVAGAEPWSQGALGAGAAVFLAAALITRRRR